MTHSTPTLAVEQRSIQLKTAQSVYKTSDSKNSTSEQTATRPHTRDGRPVKIRRQHSNRRFWHQWQSFQVANVKVINLRRDVLHQRLVVQGLEAEEWELVKNFANNVAATDKKDTGQISRAAQDLSTALMRAIPIRDVERCRLTEMERNLLQEELKLKSLSESIRLNHGGQEDDPDELTDSNSFSDRSGDVDASTSMSGNWKTRAMDRLSSKLGDIELLKIEVAELREERALLVEEEITRARIGLRLDDESEAFLATFDQHHQKLLSDLLAAEDDVQVIRAALQSGTEPEGSFDETTTESAFPQDPADVPGGVCETLFSHSASAQLGEGMKGLLLRPNQTASVFENISRSGWRDTADMATYVNYWLLHKLRSMIGELVLFEEALDLGLDFPARELGVNQLEDFISRHWFTDGSEIQYITNHELADQTDQLSIQIDAGTAQRLRAESAPELGGQFRLQLLPQTNANTTTTKLLAQTRRAVSKFSTGSH